MTSPTPPEIRAAREGAGLTQIQAAELIHCHRMSWVKWERGERVLHPALWELFCIKTGLAASKN